MSYVGPFTGGGRRFRFDLSIYDCARHGYIYVSSDGEEWSDGETGGDCPVREPLHPRRPTRHDAVSLVEPDDSLETFADTSVGPASRFK